MLTVPKLYAWYIVPYYRKICIYVSSLCLWTRNFYCVHRAKVAGSNEKAVDEGLLVMEHSRCMYMSIL